MNQRHRYHPLASNYQQADNHHHRQVFTMTTSVAIQLKICGYANSPGTLKTTCFVAFWSFATLSAKFVRRQTDSMNKKTTKKQRTQKTNKQISSKIEEYRDTEKIIVQPK